jgi:NAD(P)-dependent dehydrogenase (short-subunit alcohol dehydrogenase family)
MQARIPTMLEQGSGSIVNISSMAALKGLENLAAYSAAKGGVIGLTQQVAFEYGRQGVRVNCICPGTINTPIVAGVIPSALENFKDQHIIRRLGEPEDIAAAAAFSSPTTRASSPARSCRSTAAGTRRAAPAERSTIRLHRPRRGRRSRAAAVGETPAALRLLARSARAGG